MGMIARGPFPLGWMPDADAVDAPVGALLRADNLVLDENNILSLRLGSSKINPTPFADLDIHSLHTQALSGTRYRMAGAGNKVYANGTALSPTFAGANDVAFGTHMGQIFMARSTSRFKFDGVTVRNWGILMTGGQPTVIPTAGGSNNSDELISGDSGESPAIVYEEDNGAGPAFTDDRGGAPNEALIVNPDPSSGRAVITKTWPSDQDLTVIGSGNVAATDDSVLSVWVYIPDPSLFFQISLQISVNGPTIWSDSYNTIWFISDMAAEGKIISGWNKLTVRRGDMVRGGPGTAGKDWSTVRMIRLVIQGAVFEPGTIYVDELRIAGGTGSVLNGDYEFAYVLVRDSGSYIAQSAPSAPSQPTHFDSAAAEITVPADASRDPQVNQIWIFRRGENLDQWYRTTVWSGAIGTGAVVITDTTSDEDALLTKIIMDEDVIPVPNDIIGIEGPYYDRLFALTQTHLYPSRRLRPDNFAAAQVIRVAGPDEIAVWVKKAHGGLYIGTTKDIYRLDGTGAEYPDGTMEFTLTPVNIDNPPRNEGVGQEGSLLCYIAADGWRAFTGAGSRLLTGHTSLLYHQRDRHGISAVNTIGGRFRAAICKGQLVAITPEGSETAFTNIVYRYSFTRDRWYRQPYRSPFRSVFREPDGTLIAGDNQGFVWKLDDGNTDAGTEIPVNLWTARDGDGSGFSPKVVAGSVVNIDTAGHSATIEFYLDESDSIYRSVVGISDGLSAVAHNISSDDLWRQIQMRISGNFSGFRLSGYTISYRALPVGVKVWDSGPMNIGRQDLVWARRVRLKVRAATNLVVTPFFDGIQFSTVTIIPTAAEINKVTILDVPVGRGFFGSVPRFKIESALDFHPYWVEFQMRRTSEESEKPEIRVPSGLGGESAD